MPSKGVGAALLTVDDADRRLNPELCFTKRLDGLHQGAAGGHDVLDDAHKLAFCEHAFDAIRGSVVLRVPSHDQERQPRGQRACCGERDRAELRAGEPRGLRLVLGCGGGDPPAERREDVRPRLEPVLVQVVASTASPSAGGSRLRGRRARARRASARRRSPVIRSVLPVDARVVSTKPGNGARAFGACESGRA